MMTTMGRLDWTGWLRGIFAALIGGGAGGATNGFAANLVTPDTVNLGVGLHKFLAIVGISFAMNGILSMMFYLKQSPVPTVLVETKETTKTEITKTISATPVEDESKKN